MIKQKFQGKIYYPGKTFTEFEIIQEGKNFFRVYINMEEDGKLVKASIFSGSMEKIQRMFDKKLFEEKLPLFDN